jgi:hypothetical protein
MDLRTNLRGGDAVQIGGRLEPLSRKQAAHDLEHLPECACLIMHAGTSNDICRIGLLTRYERARAMVVPPVCHRVGALFAWPRPSAPGSGTRDPALTAART